MKKFTKEQLEQRFVDLGITESEKKIIKSKLANRKFLLSEIIDMRYFFVGKQMYLSVVSESARYDCLREVRIPFKA